MKIATWNVNSIRVRLDQILEWLQKENIDVLGMQEIKTPDDKFPYNNFRDVGYNIESFGEVGFNGVAIASKLSMEDVKKGFVLDARDQKRMISCEINGIKIINVYVPNGKNVGATDYYYKLDYLAKLKEYLSSLLKSTNRIILMGDLNVALSDLDVYNSNQMGFKIGFTSPERNAMKDILDIGFFDACREFHKNEKIFSFWDYRANSFLRNVGLRVDYILMTKEIFKKAVFCDIDAKERAKRGSSDHAPLYAQIND
ncbi:Exodeoxyribonuclease 3 [Desulfurella amilsii]|uniref:Exodeoxyribonuclease 3 n=1 Tax=Desulfurella amilsii TaxID=1562698 RepID=A0A1X4XYM6_9BACT|nr:exodeoxyribonuclease III [Desulfurella amilsii]OSS42637.1 Exodeoxyribonuclease 3 [Desulfurella amilsii]